MRHELRVEGIAFRLRPVELSDAGTIVELRRDPSRSAFIHETDASVAAQIRWLEAYFAREGDHYWAVESRLDGSTEGFLGIYDVEGTQAEWGRWVLRPGSLAAPESAWLVHEAGFGHLHLDALITRTLADNGPVVAFHERYGVELVRTLPAYTCIGGVERDAVEGVMTSAAWATSGPRLRVMAERTAALLSRSPARP